MNYRYARHKRLQGISVFSILVLALAALTADAATRTWGGGSVVPGAGGDFNWSVVGHWTGDAVPGSGDTAVFDGTCVTDCLINAAVSVTGLQMNAGYAGTVTQGFGYAITVGAQGATFSAGKFAGGTNNITVNGILTVDGTDFTSTSGTLQGNNNVVLSGGAFAHNNGTLKVKNPVGPYANTIFDTGGKTFYNLTLAPYDAGDIYVTNDCTVNGTLYEEGAHLTYCEVKGLGDPTITLNGNLIVNNGCFGSRIGSSNLWLRFTNSVDPSITLTAADAAYGGICANLLLAKTGGSIVLETNTYFNSLMIPIGQTVNAQNHDLYLHGSLSNAGTLNMGTGDVFFNCDYTANILSGGLTYNNVFFKDVGGAKYLVDDMTIGGNLTFNADSVYAKLLSSGGSRAIRLLGNLYYTNKCNLGDSSVTLFMAGATNQTIDFWNNGGAGLNCKLAVANTNLTTLLIRPLTNAVEVYTFTVAVNSNCTLDLAGNDVGKCTSFTVDGTLRLKGNETIWTAVPTLNTGSTVMYDGIDGVPVTIKNWAYKTLILDAPGRQFDWTAGATYTVSERLSINGAPGQYVTLRSSSPLTAWYINTTGASVDVNYADVQDSVSTQLIRAYHSLDSGRNVNWRFLSERTLIIMH